MKRNDYRRSLDEIRLTDKFRAEMEQKLSQPAAVNTNLNDDGDRVDHVERAPKITWKRYAATAAAVVIVGGTAGGLAYRFRNMPDPDKDNRTAAQTLVQTPFGEAGGFTANMEGYNWGVLPDIAFDTVLDWFSSNEFVKQESSEDIDLVNGQIDPNSGAYGIKLEAISGDEFTLYLNPGYCVRQAKDGDITEYTFDGEGYANWYDPTDTSEASWWSFYSLERDLNFLLPYIDMTNIDLSLNREGDFSAETQKAIKDLLSVYAPQLVRLTDEEAAEHKAIEEEYDYTAGKCQYVYTYPSYFRFYPDDVFTITYNGNWNVPELAELPKVCYKAPEGFYERISAIIEANEIPSVSPINYKSGFGESPVATATVSGEYNTFLLDEEQAEELIEWADGLSWTFEVADTCVETSYDQVNFMFNTVNLVFYDTGYVWYQDDQGDRYYYMSDDVFTKAYTRLYEVVGFENNQIVTESFASADEMIDLYMNDINAAGLIKGMNAQSSSHAIWMNYKTYDFSDIIDVMKKKTWSSYDSSDVYSDIEDCFMISSTEYLNNFYVASNGIIYSPNANTAFICDDASDYYDMLVDILKQDEIDRMQYEMLYPEKTYTTMEGDLTFYANLYHAPRGDDYDADSYYAGGKGHVWFDNDPNKEYNTYMELSNGTDYSVKYLGRSSQNAQDFPSRSSYFIEHGDFLAQYKDDFAIFKNSNDEWTTFECDYYNGTNPTIIYEMAFWGIQNMYNPNSPDESSDGVSYQLTKENGITRIEFSLNRSTMLSSPGNFIIAYDEYGTVVRYKWETIDEVTGEASVMYDFEFTPEYNTEVYSNIPTVNELYAQEGDYLDYYNARNYLEETGQLN